MPSYLLQCGDDDAVELPDDLSMAMDFMQETIIGCHLPKWREQALLTQVENMPRAGFSFTDNAGQLIRLERCR